MSVELRPTGSHLGLTESLVVELAIAHFKRSGWTTLFRTTPRRLLGEDGRAGGEQGGADAILFHPDAGRYLFLEAKGDAAMPCRASSSFNNVLGAMFKRIRVSKAYLSNEPLVGFAGSTRRERERTRDRIAADARFERTTYAIALTPAYRNRIICSLDPGIMNMLHIDLYTVDGDGTVSVVRP